MTKIFTEDEIPLGAMQAHFLDSGLNIENVKEKTFGVRSINGLYITVRIDEERKYLRFSCYFDLDKSRSHMDRLLLIQRYTFELFLANFSLDKDSDLVVSYVMSYEMGLIVGQMMHVFRRFARLLDLIIEQENDDKFIVFEEPNSTDDATLEETTSEEALSIGVASNTSTEGIAQ